MTLEAILIAAAAGRHPGRAITLYRGREAVAGLVPVGGQGQSMPIWADLPTTLDARLRQALEARGIRRLYSHQVAAWDAVQEGRHVVIITPTASDKTLCYNLPVLQAASRNRRRRCISFRPGPCRKIKSLK